MRLFILLLIFAIVCIGAYEIGKNLGETQVIVPEDFEGVYDKLADLQIGDCLEVDVANRYFIVLRTTKIKRKVNHETNR